MSPNIHHYYQERGGQKKTRVTAPPLSFGSYLPPLIFTKQGDRRCLSFLQSYKAIKEKECHQTNPHKSMQKHRDTAFAKTGFLSPNVAPSPLYQQGQIPGHTYFWSTLPRRTNVINRQRLSLIGFSSTTGGGYQ